MGKLGLGGQERQRAQPRRACEYAAGIRRAGSRGEGPGIETVQPRLAAGLPAHRHEHGRRDGDRERRPAGGADQCGAGDPWRRPVGRSDCHADDAQGRGRDRRQFAAGTGAGCGGDQAIDRGGWNGADGTGRRAPGRGRFTGGDHDRACRRNGRLCGRRRQAGRLAARPFESPPDKATRRTGCRRPGRCRPGRRGNRAQRGQGGCARGTRPAGGALCRRAGPARGRLPGWPETGFPGAGT